MKIDPIELSCKLISFQSITPDDAGALDFIADMLKNYGFTVEIMQFGDVKNIYASYGNGRNLCFAGHIDVVPAGDLSLWNSPPFTATIIDDKLYGRGAVDMKSALAASIVAAIDFAINWKAGKVSLLITSDEEGLAIDGTAKVLAELARRGERIDDAIIGEPTNPEFLGEMVKIGRRGSISFQLLINGVQGHVAYPASCRNPATILINILHKLKQHILDKGTENFDPSNLEVTTIDINNPASNVIPAKARANFNIRFNDTHKASSLIKWVDGVIAEYSNDYLLTQNIGGEAFLTEGELISDLMIKASVDVIGKYPMKSTSGGISDARFIKDYVNSLVEFGLINKTAHQSNESVFVKDVIDLTRIYRYVVELYHKL